jgi:hypothetical protein
VKILATLTLVVLLAACSNQQVYTAIQQNQMQECSKLPQARFEECMKNVEGPYEDYERDRQDLATETCKPCAR